MRTKSELRLPALEVRQSRHRVLYSFAVDGTLLPKVTTISRIVRDPSSRILGYQRPEVLSHIAEIRNSLESDDPMIPNAIVIAFDRRMRFEPLEEAEGEGFSRPGILVIPIDDRQSDGLKPGWIVDGQQRSAAIREARIPHFPVCVVAFIAESDKEQREQFSLVNSTKPLPKGLVYELLPSTEARLPTMLRRVRFPTLLLDRLNLDEDSPLRGMIRTPTVSTGVIKDNSFIKMIENSLSDGVLFRFGNEDSKRGNTERMLETLKSFWAAVAHVYRPAWGLPPKRSRLMHGAGIVSLGFVMDAIADRHRQSGTPTKEQFQTRRSMTSSPSRRSVRCVTGCAIGSRTVGSGRSVGSRSTTGRDRSPSPRTSGPVRRCCCACRPLRASSSWSSAADTGANLPGVGTAGVDEQEGDSERQFPSERMDAV